MQTKLRLLRKELKVSQQTVAEAVKIDVSHYSRVERGKIGASPDLADALSKCKFFKGKITREQILYPEDYPQPDTPAKKSKRTA